MPTPRVLKLGGSLLVRADWPQQFRSWLNAHPSPLNLLIVGGGDLVEAVRELDRHHHLDAEFTHWLCIDLLASTLRIAAQLLPEYSVVSHPEQLREIVDSPHLATETHTYLVHIAAFYSRLAPTPQLPENWSTTSDALAAWLARQVNATELVLFKSVSATSEVANPIELADRGIVDAVLPEIASDSLALRIVNLAAFSPS